jgi:hypothetical protein
MANPYGQLRDKPFRDALRMEAIALDNGEINRHPKGSLRWNAHQLLVSGEPSAIRELADRLDGKVAQTIAGDNELSPIRIEATDEQRAQAVASLLAKTNGHVHSDITNDD